MNRRSTALFCLFVLVLNLVGSAADGPKRAQTSPANQLAGLLPVSDGIVTLDVKRFFSTALPKLFSANQPMLEKITTKIDLMKDRTGIDIRQFEYLAAGVAARKVAVKDYDIDGVVIARGQVSSASLIGAAKLASNGKYREEKAGAKAVYIFSAKDIATQAKQRAPVVSNSDMVDKIVDRFSGDIAVSAVDANTIAFGEPGLVKRAVSEKPVGNSELISLLAKKETSVVNFAAKMPNGMSEFLPLENDELGKNIDSIRYVYGNMDMPGDAVALNLTARTLQPAQATALQETLEGLQLLGKAFLGNTSGADKQVYARMIANTKFSSKGNEVMIDLSVPQSDIDVLVGKLK
jgi:hypothetical protein